MLIHKPLHIATSVEALQVLAARSIEDFKNIKKLDVLYRAAHTLYKEIHRDPADEERTYILLYRFILFYRHLRNVDKDKMFVDSRFGKEVANARAELMQLEQKLIDRYKELDGDKKMVKKVQETGKNGESVVGAETKTLFNQALAITCRELMQVLAKSKNLLIIDARSATDYQESHIKDYENINIPEDLIVSGLSAHKLGLTLPEETKRKWDKRDTYDGIILLDWESTTENFYQSKLHRLRVTMTEWDLNKNYKETPVFLNGGYVEFLQMYPTHCTNSHVVYNRVNTDLDELLFLDDVIYPVDEDNNNTLNVTTTVPFLPPKPEVTLIKPAEEKEEKVGETILEREKQVSKEKQQTICKLLEKEKEWQEAYTKSTRSQDGEQYSMMAENISKEIQELKNSVNNLARTKENLARRYSSTVDEAAGDRNKRTIKELQDIDKEELRYLKIIGEMALQREQSLDRAKANKKRKSATATPTIDRSSKPQLSRDFPKIGAKPLGLIGLTNIKNTCYMNSIIQSFRHIPEIAEIFQMKTLENRLTRNPDMIFTDLRDLLLRLSKETPSSITPREFYNTIIAINSTYGLGHHEDAMEFFMFFLNLLSEDFAEDIVTKRAMTNVEKGYYDAVGGRSSIFAELFYYQIKILQVCSSCTRSTVKTEVETVFMLPLESRQRNSVEEMMENYFATDAIQDYLCKNCKGIVHRKKQLYKEPPILVIMLKRYNQEILNGVVDLRKNSAEVHFPVDDFVVGRSVYKLRAIVMHSGSLESGHYTAACRNLQDNEFYEFNDEYVRPTSINTPETRAKAFAFFYSRK